MATDGQGLYRTEGIVTRFVFSTGDFHIGVDEVLWSKAVAHVTNEAI